MFRRPTLALLLCAASTSLAAAQANPNPAAANPSSDPVYLRVGGQPGQSNKYTQVVDVFVRGGQMAAMMSPDTTLPMMRMSSFITRTVNGVSGDTVTIVEVIDSNRSESPAMPSMAAMMGGALASQIGQRTTIHMDARGRIFSTEVVSANPDAGGGGGRGPMGNMPGRRARMPFVLPERAVRPGDTWTDSVLIAASSPEDQATNYLATYRLETITPRGGMRIAVISMNGTMASNGPNGPQIMSTGGEIQFDISNRRVASFTMTAAGTVTSRGGDVPMRMVMTQTLTP